MTSLRSLKSPLVRDLNRARSAEDRAASSPHGSRPPGNTPWPRSAPRTRRRRACRSAGAWSPRACRSPSTLLDVSAVDVPSRECVPRSDRPRVRKMT
eukprot:CAMPEP_0172565212 /NCGR_PEP_ID=MMETSP1067-20121228/107373_1 /TAXON_ID=265564 ORGANISM="Thalassiosira punctigera, Strain Tpunct2005C2" /NCGR_SAMPLE_ID=MMETSP1067 /ASSEMBLY_ACC=CAM_ASM_000444 /LENGTH=96 /DNA_ID=CAMNT_0013356045 /DNA_START=12 /DNA_END=298 /DNA_ORIENTATION=+